MKFFEMHTFVWPRIKAAIPPDTDIRPMRIEDRIFLGFVMYGTICVN